MSARVSRRQYSRSAGGCSAHAGSPTACPGTRGGAALTGGRLPRRAVVALHDARDVGVDLVDRRLRARDEALALLPDLVMRVALARGGRAGGGDRALGRACVG